jgi:hypothetical protein
MVMRRRLLVALVAQVVMRVRSVSVVRRAPVAVVALVPMAVAPLAAPAARRVMALPLYRPVLPVVTAVTVVPVAMPRVRVQPVAVEPVDPAVMVTPRSPGAV